MYFINILLETLSRQYMLRPNRKRLHIVAQVLHHAVLSRNDRLARHS